MANLSALSAQLAAAAQKSKILPCPVLPEQPNLTLAIRIATIVQLATIKQAQGRLNALNVLAAINAQGQIALLSPALPEHPSHTQVTQTAISAATVTISQTKDRLTV